MLEQLVLNENKDVLFSTVNKEFDNLEISQTKENVKSLKDYIRLLHASIQRLQMVWKFADTEEKQNI